MIIQDNEMDKSMITKNYEIKASEEQMISIRYDHYLSQAIRAAKEKNEDITLTIKQNPRFPNEIIASVKSESFFASASIGSRGKAYDQLTNVRF